MAGSSEEISGERAVVTTHNRRADGGPPSGPPGLAGFEDRGSRRQIPQRGKRTLLSNCPHLHISHARKTCFQGGKTPPQNVSSRPTQPGALATGEGKQPSRELTRGRGEGEGSGNERKIVGRYAETGEHIYSIVREDRLSAHGAPQKTRLMTWRRLLRLSNTRRTRSRPRPRLWRS